MKSNSIKLLAVSLLLITANNVYAGIDWSRYDDAPIFFFGWETSFYFAIAAVVLFGISWFLTGIFKGENGMVEGGADRVVGLLNVLMIICAICSYYLLLPLGMIYILIKGLIDRK